jgi:hypothetical protein
MDAVTRKGGGVFLFGQESRADALSRHTRASVDSAGIDGMSEPSPTVTLSVR